MPVPNTRSSSLMPVERVIDVCALMLVIDTAGEVGVRPMGLDETLGALVGVLKRCSSMVPQDPHSGQRPNHLGEEYPHSLHA
ncbi:Hypothetical protein Cp106_1723 [Corynebacterium pseudotuberculosis 1/06-A]|nr:Hypothetical protein Cp106_1723 [Corynebacterium pseudotuberculosis 1/06-A]